MGQVEQTRWRVSVQRLGFTVLGSISVVALICVLVAAVWALAGISSAALGLPPLLKLPVVGVLGAAIAGLSAGALAVPVLLILLALSGGIRRVASLARGSVKRNAIGAPEPIPGNSPLY